MALSRDNERVRLTESTMSLSPGDALLPSSELSFPATYERTLYTTIRELQKNKISFIPVHGSNARAYRGNRSEGITGAKEPAILACHAYQYQRRAQCKVVQDWWNAGLFGGIGVYCGDVSRLVCADIDVGTDPDAESAFVNVFPDLLDTLTERSPTGGTHRFYRMPSDIAVPRTIAARGYGELRGNGALVVIAPTSWREKVWRIEQGTWADLYTLSLAQLERLRAFYEQRRLHNKVIAVPKPSIELKAPTMTALESLIEQQLGVTHFNADGYSNLIRCPFHEDRNPSAAWHRSKHALHCFAGCTSPTFASGWNGTMQVAAALGIQLQVLDADIAPLSVSIIERLLQVFPGKRGESLCKILLALRLHSVAEGSPFTFKQAQGACREVVGIDTLRSALTAVAPSGKGIFVGGDKVSADTYHISNNTCSQPHKNNARGRPARVYIMPTETELSHWLGAEQRGTFRLRLADLKTRSVTDLLLEQWIERHNGEYSYRLLAAQYGKSASTIRREVANNCRIQRTPTLSKQVEIRQPDEVEILTGDVRGVYGGRYLELQDSGARFRATRMNAENALAQGETVLFMERGPNHFSINDEITLAEADDYRALSRLKTQALRLLGQLERAGLLNRPRKSVRHELGTAFQQQHQVALERFIAHAKQRLQQYKFDEDAEGASCVAHGSDAMAA